MKENLSSRKMSYPPNNALNLTAEEGANMRGDDEEKYQNELKTPTG